MAVFNKLVVAPLLILFACLHPASGQLFKVQINPNSPVWSCATSGCDCNSFVDNHPDFDVFWGVSTGSCDPRPPPSGLRYTTPVTQIINNLSQTFTLGTVSSRNKPVTDCDASEAHERIIQFEIEFLDANDQIFQRETKSIKNTITETPNGSPCNDPDNDDIHTYTFIDNTLDINIPGKGTIRTTITFNGNPSIIQDVPEICSGSCSTVATFPSQTPLTTTLECTTNCCASDNDCINACEACDGGFCLADPLVITSVDTTPTSCNSNDGTITINTSGGGLGPFEYSVDGGANYQSSNVFNNLALGTYSVSVRDPDDNTCATTTTADVFGVSATLFPSDTDCAAVATGSIAVTTSNCGPGATCSYTVNTVSAAPPFTSLSEGTYNIVVTSSEPGTPSCTFSNVPIGVLYTPSVSAAPVDESFCESGDGSVVLTGSGGGTYEYSITSSSAGFQGSGVFTGLASGSYTGYVRLSENNLCFASQAFTLNSISSIDYTVDDIQPTSCASGTDGAVTVSAACPTAACSFSLAPTDGSSPAMVNSNGLFTALTAQSYDLVVSYSGCSDGETVVVPFNPSTLSVSIASNGPVTQISGCGDVSCDVNDGAVTANPSGGTAPYTYSWNTGATAASISGLSIGTYTVQVTDSVNCPASNSITLTVTGEDNVEPLDNAEMYLNWPIRWDFSQCRASSITFVDIQLWDESLNTMVKTIAANVPAAKGMYVWKPNRVYPDNYRVRIVKSSAGCPGNLDTNVIDLRPRPSSQ